MFIVLFLLPFICYEIINDPGTIFVCMNICSIGVFILLILEMIELKQNGLKSFIESYWNIADVSFIILWIIDYDIKRKEHFAAISADFT